MVRGLFGPAFARSSYRIMATAPIITHADDFDIVLARPWRILIAEDSAFWRHFVRKAVLEYAPHLEIVEAADGRAALDVLSRQPIDIAFVDLAMPEVNGDELVKRLQADRKMPFFAVISVTSDAEEIARMRKLSAYDYLVKPFGPADIVRVMVTYERVARPARVLIVDDSATARSIIGRILKRSIFNFDIVSAGDGVSAFELYAHQPADIVFLDLNMPGLDGGQTMRLLRAHNRDVRIVLMSGDQAALERHGKHGMGGAGVLALHKPFFPGDLDRVVHQIFDLPLPFGGLG